MTTLSWPTKDPDEELDYEVEWTSRIPGSDFVTSSSWMVPSGLTRTDSQIVEDGKVTVVWLSGGALGETYVVTNTVVTNEGRTLQQSVKIKVKAR